MKHPSLLIIIVLFFFSNEASTIKKFSDLVRGGKDAATVFQTAIRVPRFVIFKCTMKDCAPCKSIASHFQAIASKYSSVADFIELDVHLFDDIIRPYTIKTVPSFIIFHKGRLLSSLRGSQLIGEISKVLDQELSKEAAIVA